VGWIDWYDFLGSNKNKMKPFEEARDFSRALNLESRDKYYEWAKTNERPKDIPADPASSYKAKGWNGWIDWLGTDRVSTKGREYRTFEKARDFSRLLKLRNSNEWYEWSKSDERPLDIPSNPREVYFDKGWSGMADWLGNTILPFTEAREYARSLEMKVTEEWNTWAKTDKRPSNIPADPRHAYTGKGWIGMSDWLGNQTE